MAELDRHETEISFHDYVLMKECLDEWAADLEIGDRVLGMLKGNGDTRFRVTIQEIDEDA